MGLSKPGCSAVTQPTVSAFASGASLSPEAWGVRRMTAHTGPGCPRRGLGPGSQGLSGLQGSGAGPPVSLRRAKPQTRRSPGPHLPRTEKPARPQTVVGSTLSSMGARREGVSSCPGRAGCQATRAGARADPTQRADAGPRGEALALPGRQREGGGRRVRGMSPAVQHRGKRPRGRGVGLEAGGPAAQVLVLPLHKGWAATWGRWQRRVPNSHPGPPASLPT